MQKPTVMTTPILEAVVGSETHADSVSIVVEGKGRHLWLKFSPSCASAAITALAAHLGDYLVQHPTPGVSNMQGLRVTAFMGGSTEDGKTALVFRLEGGAELRLDIPPQIVAEMVTLLEVATSSPPAQKH